MSTVVDSTNFPEVAAALREIEYDNGGHLIGTVYPGHAMDLDRFTVPDRLKHLLGPANAALTRLRHPASSADWEAFIVGDDVERQRLMERQGDLSEANELLEEYFHGWNP